MWQGLENYNFFLHLRFYVKSIKVSHLEFQKRQFLILHLQKASEFLIWQISVLQTCSNSKLEITSKWNCEILKLLKVISRKSGNTVKPTKKGLNVKQSPTWKCCIKVKHPRCTSSWWSNLSVIGNFSSKKRPYKVRHLWTQFNNARTSLENDLTFLLLCDAMT